MAASDDDDILSVGDNGRQINKYAKQKFRVGQREKNLNDVVVNYLLEDINTTSEKIYIIPSNIFANLQKEPLTNIAPWLPDMQWNWELPACVNEHW